MTTSPASKRRPATHTLQWVDFELGRPPKAVVWKAPEKLPGPQVGGPKKDQAWASISPELVRATRTACATGSVENGWHGLREVLLCASNDRRILHVEERHPVPETR